VSASPNPLRAWVRSCRRSPPLSMSLEVWKAAWPLPGACCAVNQAPSAAVPPLPPLLPSIPPAALQPALDHGVARSHAQVTGDSIAPHRQRQQIRMRPGGVTCDAAIWPPTTKNQIRRKSNAPPPGPAPRRSSRTRSCRSSWTSPPCASWRTSSSPSAFTPASWRASWTSARRACWWVVRGVRVRVREFIAGKCVAPPLPPLPPALAAPGMQPGAPPLPRRHQPATLADLSAMAGAQCHRA